VNDGRESEVVADFVRWLEANGWSVTTEVDWVDVVAERNGVQLIGEAKGITTSPGLDSDTMMGQLLRRMTVNDETTRYAIIVPDKLVPVALRVPERIRRLLRIEVFGVSEDGSVTTHRA
jgi:hypothetical protein